MLRLLAVALFGVLLSKAPLEAQTAGGPGTAPEAAAAPLIPPPPGRQRIGYGRLITNDLIGDGNDRWRTGSLTVSRVWAADPWSGRAPAEFGNLLELRTQGEIISPENLVTYNPADRRWAGRLALGLHTHWRQGPAEFSMGGNIVMVGPQTRLDQFQGLLHDMVNTPGPSSSVRANQIGNQIVPTFVGEVGHTFEFGAKSRLRPFAEVRAGDEDMVRFGADFTVGRFGAGELLIRESVTGHRYRAVRDPTEGTSFVFGADVAKVYESTYLPASLGYQMTDHRSRVRAGIHWQGEGRSFFYGLTWLGKEFVGQRANQVVGSVRLQFPF